MRVATTNILLALSALTLAACGGTDDKPTVASRVARAVTRTMVDALIEADQKTQSPAEARQSEEPLSLASSRPDTILATEIVEPLASYHIDAMTEASRGAMTINLNDGPSSEIGHVVTATVLSDFAKKCGDREPDSEVTVVSEREAELRTTQCPLARRSSGNLTRT